MAHAPNFRSLPTPRRRATRGGPEFREIHVRLEVVTPILGGSHHTREIDDVDVIRAPSVRGHLRFWWRALYAANYANADALYQRESALWGRAATDDGGRSAVEIRVSVKRAGDTDKSDIQLYRKKEQMATPGAYALWPARGETRTNTPPAPRRKPGTQFQLTLKVAGTETDEGEVRNALRAWILFGGYGGRTRRGLGSLNVTGDVNGWLPTAATREAFISLFGVDVFAAPAREPCDVPWLGGAAVHVSTPSDAQKAWTTALAWLKEFRQGTSGRLGGGSAREPAIGVAQPNRPSISNWPEADKIRQLVRPRQGQQWTHEPRHNASAAWPRAGFGLPIIGQFQTTDRNGTHDAYVEPDPFELRWCAGEVEYDRLASPLIVKALPIANGKFAPCAIWLNRGLPAGAQVGLAQPNQDRPNKKEVDPATVALFDSLIANGDHARFRALVNKTSLRQAFLEWLCTECPMTVVAP